MTAGERRNFLLFTGGRLVSLIGTSIQTVAVPLYILDRTGSGALMGLFTVLSVAPLVLVSPIAGVAGDRFNRKHIAVLTDLFRGGLVTLLAVLAFAGDMNLILLFTGQVFVAIMDSMFNASTAAMLADLVQPRSLTRANAVKGAVDGISMIIGPALGGVVYGFGGIRLVLLLNGSSFLLSAACETFIRYLHRAAGRTPLTLAAVVSESREILAYVVERQGLFRLFLYAMVFNFFAGPTLLVLMPFLLKKVIGFTSIQYGWLMTFFTSGVFLGNVLIGSVFSKTANGRLMKTGVIVVSLFFLAIVPFVAPKEMAFLEGYRNLYFLILGTGLACAGLFDAFINTPMITMFQTVVPSDLRARFFSVLTLFGQLAIPLGAALIGVLLDAVPAWLLLAATGLVLLAATAVYLRSTGGELFEPERNG